MKNYKLIIAALTGGVVTLSIAYLKTKCKLIDLEKENNKMIDSFIDLANVSTKFLKEVSKITEEDKEEPKKENEEPKKETPTERSFVFTRSLHFKNSEEAKDFILWWNAQIDSTGRITYRDICEKLGFVNFDIAAHYDKHIDLDGILFSTIDNSYKIILPIAIIEQYTTTNEE